MTYIIHFDNISVGVTNNEPFIMLRDKYEHLTGSCRSTDVGIEVSDIIVGDTIYIAGSQGPVTNIEEVKGGRL